MARLKTSKYLQSPWLEGIIMVSSIVLSYFGLAILSLVPGTPAQGEMATSVIAWILFAFFMLSVAIAMISVIAGIGGGVIFTPIMLAFTNVNSVVVRGTGLIVAMFSGLISTGIFMKKGIGNYRLCLVMTLSQGFGALAGSTIAVATAAGAGAGGEGLMRLGLGVILLMISVYFFSGGKKLEWPEIKHIDSFTRRMRLGGNYFEESEGIIREYEVTRAPLGILLVFLVGVLGGFFGMGGGWAITPSLNLGMGLPLKLAAANSGVILGIGSCVSIWPYIYAGGVIPFFALPWLAGQVIGGFIGSYVLARIKVHVVRLILIGIMLFTSFGLVTKGLEILGLMGRMPPVIQVAVFTVCLGGVMIALFSGAGKEKKQNG
ncbi:sulfite exporter TauE/SafE family protein [Treponema sp. OttesenSCG-928-L16]|nr:sulfite exporter TauE/SafE family protein [Treponema sp. OttesenSCG-928-L16]